MHFDQFALDPRLLQAVAAAGYVEPTPIQERAIPVVLQGRDVVGLAQTGTGKTAAFGLPILQRLLTDGGAAAARPALVHTPADARGRGGRIAQAAPTRGVRGAPVRAPFALIVVPTRELAEQIRQSLTDLGRHTSVRIATIYGGVSKVPQTQVLRQGVDIIVACPGRLLDLESEGNVDLSGIRTLVLDEADHLLDMGFFPDVRRILGLVPRERQTLLFSATMPPEIRKLAESALRSPEEIRIGRIEPAKTVTQGLYELPSSAAKADLLLALLDDMKGEKVLVFTRTKHRAKGLARKLARAGHRVSDLQGNMAQNQRDRAIQGFRNGDLDVLVATDIAARGIDVAEIAQVINFDITNTVDAYTHRIGRTGRARRTGSAVTFVTPEDRDVLRSIEQTTNARIERLALPEIYRVRAASILAESEAVHGPETARGGRTPAQASRPGSDRSGSTRGRSADTSRSRGNGSGASRSQNGADTSRSRGNGSGASRSRNGAGPRSPRDGHGARAEGATRPRVSRGSEPRPVAPQPTSAPRRRFSLSGVLDLIRPSQTPIVEPAADSDFGRRPRRGRRA